MTQSDAHPSSFIFPKTRFSWEPFSFTVCCMSQVACNRILRLATCDVPRELVKHLKTLSNYLYFAALSLMIWLDFAAASSSPFLMSWLCPSR